MRNFFFPICLIIFTFLSMCIINDSEEWKPGEVVILFKVGINETVAINVIESYNLTIIWISDLESSDCDKKLEVHVKVPEGREIEYANLLRQNPDIDDAYRKPPPPR